MKPSNFWVEVMVWLALAALNAALLGYATHAVGFGSLVVCVFGFGFGATTTLMLGAIAKELQRSHHEHLERVDHLSTQIGMLRQENLSLQRQLRTNETAESARGIDA